MGSNRERVLNDIFILARAMLKAKSLPFLLEIALKRAF